MVVRTRTAFSAHEDPDEVEHDGPTALHVQPLFTPSTASTMSELIDRTIETTPYACISLGVDLLFRRLVYVVRSDTPLNLREAST